MTISIVWSDASSDYKTNSVIDGFGNPFVSASAGDFIIVCTAADSDAYPANLVVSTTLDVKNYALSTVVSASNTGNVVCGISWGYIDSQPIGTWQSTSVSGLNVSEAKAATIYIVRGLESSPFDKGASNTGTGDHQSSGASTDYSQADNIVIGAIGTEHKLSELASTWSVGPLNIYGNELSDGTEANGSAANIVIRSAAKIVSSTQTQVALISGEDACDWAACMAAFKGAAAEANVQQVAQYYKRLRGAA